MWGKPPARRHGSLAGDQGADSNRVHLPHGVVRHHAGRLRAHDDRRGSEAGVVPGRTDDTEVPHG